MTTSILNDALLLRRESPEKLQEYLHSINLTIFDAIFHNSSNVEEAKQSVLYILCCYSEDSPLIILRRDSDEEKDGICEFLEIPDFMRGKLRQLTDQDTRNATTAYLQQFSGSLFKALKMMEIQLEDLSLAITTRQYAVKPDDHNEKISLYDFKEHGKAVTQYEIILKRKDALEKEIKSQITYKAILELKEHKYQNVDKKIKKGNDGISLENSKFIKLGHG